MLLQENCLTSDKKMQHQRLGLDNVLKYCRVLLPYIALISLFIFLFLFTYYKSIEQTKARETEQAILSVSRAIDYIDNDFVNAYATLETAKTLPDIVKLYNACDNFQLPDFFKLLCARKTLAATTPKSNIVVDFALVYMSGNKAIGITPTHIMYDMERLHQFGLYQLGTLDYMGFLGNLNNHADDNLLIQGFGNSMRLKTIDAGEYNTIPYIKRLLTTGECKQLYGIIFLDEEKIRQLLLPEGNTSILYSITNQEGILLSGTPGLAEASSKNQNTKLTFLSPKTKLIYTVLIPKTYFAEKLSYFNVFYQVALLILFIGICALAMLLVVMVVKPLNNIINRLGKPAGRNVFYSLSAGIDYLSDANKGMQQTLNAWKPMVKSDAINRLLEGKTVTAKGLSLIQELAKRTDYVYYVFLFGITDSQKEHEPILHDRNLDSIAQVVNRYFALSVIHPVGRHKFVHIANIPKDQGKNEITTKLSNILNDLCSAGLSCTVGAGQETNELARVYLSYNDAVKAFIVTKRNPSKRICWFEDIGTESASYNFSYINADKLLSLLLAGEDEQAVILLEQLITQTFSGKNPQYSNSIFKQFFYDITGVLMRISSRLQIDDIMLNAPEYNDETNISDMFMVWKGMFHQIAQRARESSQSRGLLESILDYIDENFTDERLCLKDLSSKFGVSEKYISTLFKDKTGCNFSDYLEDMRLGYAQMQMKVKGMTIGEIARMAGYNNPSTFYKAFKRKYGMTPSRYQTLLQAGLQDKCLIKAN